MVEAQRVPKEDVGLIPTHTIRKVKISPNRTYKFLNVWLLQLPLPHHAMAKLTARKVGARKTGKVAPPPTAPPVSAEYIFILLGAQKLCSCGAGRWSCCLPGSLNAGKAVVSWVCEPGYDGVFG
jgi:hypothetical protein